MKTTENKAVYTFTPHTVICNGQEFPAEYSINPTSNTVFAFLTVQEDGCPVKLRLRVEPSEPEHSAILAAAQQEHDKRVAAKQEHPAAMEPAPAVELCEYYTLRRPPMPGGIPAGAVSVEDSSVPRHIPGHGTALGIVRYNRELTAKEIADYELCPVYTGKSVQESAPVEQEQPAAVEPATIDQQDAPKAPEAVPVQQDAPQTVDPAPVEQEQPAVVEPAPAAQQERDPKQAHGPIPEKPFIGLEIKGNGWKILFDSGHERTRVIFKDNPCEKARAAVEKAGFYWSPVLQSWNKKLTFKAYRAAQALALDLRAVCG